MWDIMDEMPRCFIKDLETSWSLRFCIEPSAVRVINIHVGFVVERFAFYLFVIWDHSGPSSNSGIGASFLGHISSKEIEP
jgi:hypothetical protein